MWCLCVCETSVCVCVSVRVCVNAGNVKIDSRTKYNLFFVK